MAIDYTTTAQTTPQTSFNQTTPTISPTTTYNSQNIPLPTSTTIGTAPAVYTSKPAQEDYNKIQTNYQTLQSGINQQQQTLTASTTQAKLDAEKKAQTDLQAQEAARKQKETELKAAAISGGQETSTTDLSSYIGKTGFNPQTGKEATIYNIGKNPDGSYTFTFSDSPTSQNISQVDFKYATDSVSGEENYRKTQMIRAGEEAERIKQDTANQILAIQNGTVPLSSGQLAQLAELRNSFNQLIDQQKLANIGAKGAALSRGYGTGAAEYGSAFQNNVIGTIISTGAQKIADLNIKMASALATMEQGFRTDNIETIKAANKLLQEAQEEREKRFKTMLDDAQKKVKEEQDRLLKEEEAYYDQVTKPIQDLAKVAANMGADSSITSKILASTTLGEAYEAAGLYSSGGTGIIAEYNYYKNQAEEAGIPYVDFNTYQDLDANRKAVAAGGVTSGAPSSYKEWELAGRPGTYAEWLKERDIKAPTVAQQTVAEYAARIEQSNPTITKLQEDIVKMNIASFYSQISMPPALQTKTIQQYMQASRNFINAKLRRESGAVISPTEFSEARAQYLPQPGDSDEVLQMKKANRELVFASLKKAAGPAYSSVDELLGTGNMLIQTEQQAEQNLKDYITQNPDKAAEINQKIQTMEKTIGRPITASEFYQAFPEYNR